MVSGKLPPGKFPPIKLPPGEFPQGKFPPGKFPPMFLNIPTHVFRFFLFINITVIIVVNYILPVGSECFCL